MGIHLSGDRTVALRRDPYRFISHTCRASGNDIFSTRILLQRTHCMTGREAARWFYEEDHFSRVGALPDVVKKPFFGEGVVQGMDDAAHADRKALLLSVLGPQHMAGLLAAVGRGWQDETQHWPGCDGVAIYKAAKRALGRSVCAWAGLPHLGARPDRLAALYEGAGALGLDHLKARRARRLLEDHIVTLVEQVRSGSHALPERSAAHTIATHRNQEGDLLDARVAAAEIINILRPIVAVAVYVAFLVHALHVHDVDRASLSRSRAAHAFVQEVRRFYPFFPAVAAVARHRMEWRGHRFQEGDRVLLDLYGTNRDTRLWDEPDVFLPERFAGGPPDAYSFIPQGGGESMGHRCAGEHLTVALMEQALSHLLPMEYDVPQQRLQLPMHRLPPVPEDGMMLANVQLA